MIFSLSPLPFTNFCKVEKNAGAISVLNLAYSPVNSN